uniref:Uncharacterized protein n=1 Tax=Coccidioides posadasii RMSCC 3488 TaxID=454284 RepID=A0A0J6F367_COCPO|nr:hypothetical protein CPAG_00920 [Coccidioides posadasii RMSCC 3488]
MASVDLVRTQVPNLVTDSVASELSASCHEAAQNQLTARSSYRLVACRPHESGLLKVVRRLTVPPQPYTPVPSGYSLPTRWIGNLDAIVKNTLVKKYALRTHDREESGNQPFGHPSTLDSEHVHLKYPKVLCTGSDSSAIESRWQRNSGLLTPSDVQRAARRQAWLPLPRIVMTALRSSRRPPGGSKPPSTSAVW